MKSPADQLRAARVRAGLTQRQLADFSGVRQPNIAAYECGQRQPSADMLQRLLQATRPRPSVLLDAHRADIRWLAGKHHADNVRVFGSAARGTDGPTSDLDLLVTFDEDASLIDHIELIQDLQELLGVGVDVVSDRGLRERDVAVQAEAVPV
jgi:uncharacterized protein